MPDSYPLPYRYTALTGYQMDFWDTVYFLAAQGGGRSVTSSRELTEFSRVPRARLNALLKSALDRGALCQDTPLDAPSAWHYELIVPGFHTETAILHKPAGYVANGWLRLVRPAYPKRLLNYLLSLDSNLSAPRLLDWNEATHKLRRYYSEGTRAKTPVALERIQEALDALIHLELVVLLPDGQFKLDLSRFDQAAPLDGTAEESSERYRGARAQDALRARRALDLVRSGALSFGMSSFEDSFEAAFHLLADLPARDLPRLRRLLRRNLHLPTQECWQRATAALQPPPPTPPDPSAWPRLRRRAWQHTRLALAQLLRDKHQPATFASRPAAQATYERFLAGPRPGLLLVGPAGVGKSSLLAHWAEGGLDRGDVVLFTLAPALSAIPDQLARLIDPCLRLPTPPAAAHRLLLLVDAINEVPDPPALLAALNGLLMDMADYPWAKMVLSCRTLAWRDLARRDLIYLDLLHHENDGPTVALAPFDEAELTDAYARYRSHYELNGDLADLSQSTQSLIRLPLLLGLAARTFRGRAIPEQLAGGQIIQPYLQACLPSLACHALLRHLTRRMAAQKKTILLLSELLDDPTLARFFLPGGILSLSKEGDLPYHRLIDEGVLNEVNTPHGEAVTFTYERVLEHVVGQLFLPARLGVQSIVKSAQTDGDWRPLWGATVARLAEEAPLAMLKDLARHPDGNVRGLIRDALLLRHDRDNVRDLLAGLASGRDRKGVHTALAVALECRLSGVILLTLDHSDLTVREQGVLHAYYFWYRDRDQGWALLAALGQRAVGRFGLPRRRLIEALVQVTVLIVINHLNVEDYAQLTPLIGIWRGVIRRLPVLGGRSRLAHRAQKIFIGVVEQVTELLLKSTPFEQQQPTFDENNVGLGRLFADFYALPQAQRDELALRLPYLDPDRHDIGDEATAQALIELAAMRSINQFFWSMASDCLAAHYHRHPTATLAVLDRMLANSCPDVVACGASAANVIAWHSQPFCTKAADVAARFFWSQWRQHGPAMSEAYFEISRVMAFEARKRAGPLQTPARLLADFSNAPDVDDGRSIAAFVAAINGLGRLALVGYPRPALQAMQSCLADERPAVRWVLVTNLCRLRVLFPDDVDDLLHDAPRPLAHAVQDTPAPLVLWYFIGQRFIEAWTAALAIAPTRRFILATFHTVLGCSDWPEARRTLILELVQALRGD